MSIASLANKVTRFAGENSPEILTAIGVTGTITTAYLTGKASYKAYTVIAVEETRVSEDPDLARALSKKETIKAVWPLYIPPVIAGGLTVASIVMANRI